MSSQMPGSYSSSKVGGKRKRSELTVARKKTRYAPKRRLTKRDPFPLIMRNVSMRYQDAPGATLSWGGGATYYASLHTKPTALFDYDYTNVVGNKQPLYYDTLLTATGPYANYLVRKWKTTFTVVNMSAVPVVVFVGQASLSGSVTELDQPTEIQNFPDVKKVFLTEKGGEKCIAQITVWGDLKKWTVSNNDDDFVGFYNSNPTN